MGSIHIYPNSTEKINQNKLIFGGLNRDNMHNKIVPLILIALSLFTTQLFAQAKEIQKGQVRAAWLTTAYRLDWPQTLIKSEQDTIQQQEELINILDQLKEAKFNTILFQVRHKGTVIYPSAVEPFSNTLSTLNNNTPKYDPLKFAISECHKRGMECHAWLVTLPFNSYNSDNNRKYRNPLRHLVKHNKSTYLSPSHQDTKLYLSQIINEITTNYDIDGIHLDYLRYPENITESFDKKAYTKSRSNISLEDWRRDNITAILKHIHREVKKLKPWVKISTSPIGKHSDTSRYSSNGWNAYHTVYQDVHKWMQEGIVDQIYPMVYFQSNNFYPFVLDWNEHKHACQVIPGLGIYFLVDPDRTWSINEINRQINFLEDNKLDGIACFRAAFLLKNSKGVLDELKTYHFKNLALTPPIKNASQSPLRPIELKVKINREGTFLKWSPNLNNKTAVTYNLYRSDQFPVDTKNQANLLDTKIPGDSYHYTPELPYNHYCYYAITAIDRYGNESEEATQLIPTQDILILE